MCDSLNGCVPVCFIQSGSILLSGVRRSNTSPSFLGNLSPTPPRLHVAVEALLTLCRSASVSTTLPCPCPCRGEGPRGGPVMRTTLLSIADSFSSGRFCAMPTSSGSVHGGVCRGGGLSTATPLVEAGINGSICELLLQLRHDGFRFCCLHTTINFCDCHTVNTNATPRSFSQFAVWTIVLIWSVRIKTSYQCQWHC
jgi:hypothetical protein